MYICQYYSTTVINSSKKKLIEKCMMSDLGMGNTQGYGLVLWRRLFSARGETRRHQATVGFVVYLAPSDA